MRFGRDRAFWIVLGGLALLYVIAAVARGQFGSVGPRVAEFAITVVALVLAITVHEAAHAWAANELGDPTARLAGRLTLNPLAHLDPLGSVMMVLTALTGVGIGWGKPTPVSPWRLRYGARKGNGIVALAGPTSNILLATLVGLVLRLVPLRVYWALESLHLIVLVNLYIAMFNLLPIPPLDGHSVLLALLSLSRGRWAWNVSQFLQRLEAQGPLLLISLIMLTQFLRFPLLGWAVGLPAGILYRLIVG
jgi:Zn-dependent protease